MADRDSPPLCCPLKPDLASALAVAQQRQAEAVGRSCRQVVTLVGLPMRFCRMLVHAWLRRLERRIQAAVGALDEARLLDESPQSRQP
ncbi:MAG TPA: hypothetical protein VKT26_07735 [Acetobacteraceae bacterium]|nr:hypothetical protein [Acetobacteraceae bacterium]